MKNYFTVTIISVFCVLSAYSQQTWQSYPYLPQSSVLSFPADDGKHSGSQTKSEWWYLNLHVIGSAPQYKVYDVMLCYFSKPASMRIFNIATPASGAFHTNVNMTPFVFSQQTGKWDLTYKIPFLINDYSQSTFPIDNKTFSYFFHAEEPGNNDELNVTVASNHAPLVVGGDGFIAIGDQGDSSFYYSYSNMKVEGTIKFNGVEDNITSGIGWIDRQWGPFTVGTNPNNLYEWFSLQVDNPGTTLGIPQASSEFNIWQIYSDSNSVPYTPPHRLVSAMYADNSQDTISNFIFERTGYWRDPADNKYYSNGWRLINPMKGVNIDIVPTIQDQVVDVMLFKFWEGGTALKGMIGNQKVEGNGFAELVAGHKFNITVPSIPTNLTGTSFPDHYKLNWSASQKGTYPIGGYRIYRSTSNNGYWNYLATTTNLSFSDFPESMDSIYFYTVTSFDNQTSTSASNYAAAVSIVPMGVKSISQATIDVRFYPNPASNKLFIELKNYINTSVEVTNIEGQLVQSLVLQAPKTQIDISNLLGGFYIVKFINEDGIVSKKLIKQ